MKIQGRNRINLRRLLLVLIPTALVFILIADWSIHSSLMRLSHQKLAKLWFIGIVIIEAAISLLLFLPLADATMGI